MNKQPRPEAEVLVRQATGGGRQRQVAPVRGVDARNARHNSRSHSRRPQSLARSLFPTDPRAINEMRGNGHRIVGSSSGHTAMGRGFRKYQSLNMSRAVCTVVMGVAVQCTHAGEAHSIVAEWDICGVRYKMRGIGSQNLIFRKTKNCQIHPVNLIVSVSAVKIEKGPPRARGVRSCLTPSSDGRNLDACSRFWVAGVFEGPILPSGPIGCGSWEDRRG